MSETTDGGASDDELAMETWFETRVQPPHLWDTLGYRRLPSALGTTVLAWEGTAEYGFPTAAGPIVQGGLVTALLDAAMGGACRSAIGVEDHFLTADLRVEFLRPAHVGLMSAHGWVVRRTRRVVFCAAELHRGETKGTLIASSRCTQIVLPPEDYSVRPADGGASAVDVPAP